MTYTDGLNPDYRRIFHGQDEPIFRVLPERVQDNFRSSASENALLWNTFYPRRFSLELVSLLKQEPLWGSRLDLGTDVLEPYFWGFNVEGERLSQLDPVLEKVDGPGQKTEVDLFMLGSSSLIAVEAKNRSGLGRCARYSHHRCPEIHPDSLEGEVICAYWEDGAARFSSFLDFGERPEPEDNQPPCARYYQLARTLLVVVNLAAELNLRPFLWLLIPKSRWPGFQREWVDFAGRILDSELWRSARVLNWESVRQIPSD